MEKCYNIYIYDKLAQQFFYIHLYISPNEIVKDKKRIRYISNPLFISIEKKYCHNIKLQQYF